MIFTTLFQLVSGVRFLKDNNLCDNNCLVVKFDETTEFGGEKFRGISWSRNKGNEKYITFYFLITLLKFAGVIFKEE